MKRIGIWIRAVILVGGFVFWTYSSGNNTEDTSKVKDGVIVGFMVTRQCNSTTEWTDL